MSFSLKAEHRPGQIMAGRIYAALEKKKNI
jgi:hypothetical protein